MLRAEARPSGSKDLLVTLMYWLKSPFNSRRLVYTARSPDPEARTSARPYSPMVKTKAPMAELFTKPAASVPRSTPGQSTKAVWNRPALTETLTPPKSFEEALAFKVTPAADKAKTFPAGATNRSPTLRVNMFGVLMAPPSLASNVLATMFNPPPVLILLVPARTNESADKSITLRASTLPA